MTEHPFAKLLKISALFSYFLLTGFNNYAGFIDDQLKYNSVKNAYEEKYEIIQTKLTRLSIEVNQVEVLIKAYKYEMEFKVFVRNKSTDEWLEYETFEFCSLSGYLGPKVREYDFQVPEGYYYINHFNPYSSFILSLGINYPNRADILKRPADRKGSGIYFHGGCATIGCIPLTDEKIKEIYILAALARNNGQEKIESHIFPFHLTENNFSMAIQKYPEHTSFWKNLMETERYFDSLNIQKNVLIDRSGDYYTQ
jgi:murein L,D-transpeptidase YafK